MITAVKVRDDGGEGRADDERDRELDQVAAEDECLEAAHDVVPSRVSVPAVGRLAAEDDGEDRRRRRPGERQRLGRADGDHDQRAATRGGVDRAAARGSATTGRRGSPPRAVRPSGSAATRSTRSPTRSRPRPRGVRDPHRGRDQAGVARRAARAPPAVRRSAARPRAAAPRAPGPTTSSGSVDRAPRRRDGQSVRTSRGRGRPRDGGTSGRSGARDQHRSSVGRRPARGPPARRPARPARRTGRRGAAPGEHRRRLGDRRRAAARGTGRRRRRAERRRRHGRPRRQPASRRPGVLRRR